MKKEKVELAIVGAGVLIFIILFANMLAKTAKKREVAAPVFITEAGVALPKAAAIKPAEAERRDLTWGRDPFNLTRIESKERRSAQLVLNGIIWDEVSPYAIINDDVVKKGDKVNGSTVIDIKEDSVVLDTGTELITLKLWQ